MSKPRNLHLHRWSFWWRSHENWRAVKRRHNQISALERKTRKAYPHMLIVNMLSTTLTVSDGYAINQEPEGYALWCEDILGYQPPITGWNVFHFKTDIDIITFRLRWGDAFA